LGRVITELSNKTWSAGRNSITWDADHFSSGVYFIHFTAGDYQKTQRIVLLK
jgi:5-hydroxyisourate hydrolase-like protein (transthyretin family)